MTAQESYALEIQRKVAADPKLRARVEHLADSFDASGVLSGKDAYKAAHYIVLGFEERLPADIRDKVSKNKKDRGTQSFRSPGYGHEAEMLWQATAAHRPVFRRNT